MDDLKALDPQEFWIEGHPNTNHRPRVVGTQVYMDSDYKAWREVVGWSAKKAGVVEIEGTVTLSLVFFTKTHYKQDFDNLAKGVAEGLEGIAFANDNQIYDCFISKRPLHPSLGEGVKVLVAPYFGKRFSTEKYPPYEHRFLALLNAKMGEIVRYEVIMRHVWDFEDMPQGSIENLTFRLRQKGFTIKTHTKQGLELVAWPEGLTNE